MNEEKELLAAYRVRCWYSASQEVLHDGGEPGDAMIKAAAAVVFQNPFAGKFVADLSPLIKPSVLLGRALGRRAIALLGGRTPQSYGKAEIAGVNGEQEQVVACVTTIFGDALREVMGGGKAWISSATKVASAGAQVDIPLAHKDELYVRSHYDAMTIAVPDSPRPDEIMICVAVASSGRVHERVGGVSANSLPK